MVNNIVDNALTWKFHKGFVAYSIIITKQQFKKSSIGSTLPDVHTKQCHSKAYCCKPDMDKLHYCSCHFLVRLYTVEPTFSVMFDFYGYN